MVKTCVVVDLWVGALLHCGEHALDVEEFWGFFQECFSRISPKYSSNLLPGQPPKRKSFSPPGKDFFIHFPCSVC